MAYAYIDGIENGENLPLDLPTFESEECFCDRDITEKELENIIKKLRSKNGGTNVFKVKDLRSQGKVIHSHYNASKFDDEKVYKKGEIYLFDHSSSGYYNIATYKFVTKTKPQAYTNDAIFASLRVEKIPASEANCKTFVEHLNCAFTLYGVKTCIQKIHFLAQCYHETNNFVDTSEEGEGKNSYGGGKNFKGRGIIQVTSDYNYLPYYDEARINGLYVENNFYDLGNGEIKYLRDDEVTKYKDGNISYSDDDDYDLKKVKESPIVKYYNFFQYKNKIGEDIEDLIVRKNKNKEQHGFPNRFITDRLTPFAKVLANNLQHACYSAAFFWKSNEINKKADEDDSNGVSLIINKHDKKTFPKRKKITKSLKEIFNYEENCKNKK